MNNNLNVKIREANNSDIDFLFNLRNMEETYRYFKNSRKVNYQEHINWITPILNKKRQDIFLYVIYHNQNKAGQIRFDLENKKIVEVSISLLKEFWGKKIARKGLDSGIEKMRKKGIEKILAEVKTQNQPALKFFEKEGFVETSKKNEYKFFEYNIK